MRTSAPREWGRVEFICTDGGHGPEPVGVLRGCPTALGRPWADWASLGELLQDLHVTGRTISVNGVVSGPPVPQVRRGTRGATRRHPDRLDAYCRQCGRKWEIRYDRLIPVVTVLYGGAPVTDTPVTVDLSLRGMPL